jgi:hypothetical protein
MHLPPRGRDNKKTINTECSSDKTEKYKLVWYLVLVVLKNVVGPRAEVEEGLFYDSNHVGGGLEVGSVWLKANPE